MTISPVSSVNSAYATEAINQRAPSGKTSGRTESSAQPAEDTVKLSPAAQNQLKTTERG
jgi:hypothetical protein